jgi:hypothetical protein
MANGQTHYATPQGMTVTNKSLPNAPYKVRVHLTQAFLMRYPFPVSLFSAPSGCPTAERHRGARQHVDEWQMELVDV